MNDNFTMTHSSRPRGGRSRPKRLLKPFPVHDEKDYGRAIGVLDHLMPLDHPNKNQRDFIDIMIPVIEAYENQHHRIDTSRITAIDLLNSLLKDHEMTASDLGRLLGNRTLGSAILSGRRELSKTHIRILAQRFCLEPGAFF